MDASPRFCSIPIGSAARPPLHSTVLQVAALLSADDCAALVGAADEHVTACREAHVARYGSPPSHPSPRVRIPVAKLACARARSIVRTLLDDTLVRLLEAELPEVAQSCFGRDCELARMCRNYTGAEPAINMYTAGGAFEAHQDQQHLTVLVQLSDGYTGGGTSFWPQEQTPTPMEPALAAAALLPGTDVVVRPEVGSALLWNGLLTHAGRAVEAGTRHILVASFSLRDVQREAERGVALAG
jgi:hypothetical protein